MRLAYEGIYRDLKTEIEKGTFGYGTLLPSQAQLVSRYGVAHNTVRKALANLASEGYCQPIHGKGVRVIWRPTQERRPFVIGDIETFAESAARNKLDAATEVKSFERVLADKAIARLTGFAPATELLHIERVRLLDGKPRIHDESYYRATSVEGLTSGRARLSIYSYMEDVLGTKIVTSKRSFTVEHSTRVDDEWLDLEGRDYVAVIHRQTYDGNGMMFEYTQSRHHPDYFCLHDTVTRQR